MNCNHSPLTEFKRASHAEENEIYSLCISASCLLIISKQKSEILLTNQASVPGDYNRPLPPPCPAKLLPQEPDNSCLNANLSTSFSSDLNWDMTSGDFFRVREERRKLKNRQWLAEKAIQKATEMENCTALTSQRKSGSTDECLLVGGFFQIKQEIYSL